MKTFSSFSFAALITTIGVTATPVAFAQAKSEPEYTFSGNAGLFTDYRFRGFTQTGYNPAFQGGFDLSTKAGFYVGNWNSNVKETLYTGASLEMDFYGGFKGSAGNLSYDVGAIYYYYPGSGISGLPTINNTELYGGLSFGPVGAKLFYATSDYFKAGALINGESTKGTTYLDLYGNFDVGNGWIINAHYGLLSLKKADQFVDVDGNVLKKNVYDYKLGVTKDLSGWTLAAAIIGTNKKGYFSSGVLDNGTNTGLEAGGKTGAVLSVSKTF
jgi:uncharacterized protein (TIGR02001 family)